MVLIDKMLRSLFGVIDSLFAWAAGVLYTLIVQIANVDIFGNYIYEFMGRIYVYLSIFMLFKLSISVVNYVLNPDQLTDKSKGFGKLIQNVIIVIGLIIMVPTIFDWAYKLQSAILNTNVLYTIITGKKNDSSYDPTKLSGKDSKEIVEIITKDSEEAGDQIKYEIMSSFIYNEKTSPKAPYAESSTEKVCDDKVSYKDKFDCLMSGDTINNTSAKNYGFTKKGFTNEYKFLISTVCIGFTAYLFLVFAFDVALRCVKLGALQLIAPIPIISMLDPNSSKNGMFSKWLKECTKTYTSLFIRLIGVYFAIEIIKGMTESGRFVWRDTGGVAVDVGFVKVFIILGLLMFAKQLPQFIETITGIKLDSGGLSLKKKLGSVPGLGKATAGAMGFVGGMAANTWALGRNIKNNGWRKAFTGHQSGAPLKFNDFTRGTKTFFSGMAGGFGAAYRASTSKDKNPIKAAETGISSSAQARNLNLQRRELDADGIKGWASRTGTHISNVAGIESGANKMDEASKKLSAISTAKDNLDKYLEDNEDKHTVTVKGKTYIDVTAKMLKKEMDAAAQRGDFEEVGNIKARLDAVKNEIIAKKQQGDTTDVMLNAYNNSVKEANNAMSGAKDLNGEEVIKIEEAQTYSDVGKRKDAATDYQRKLTNDGIKMNDQNWSQAHTKIEQPKK